MNAAGGAMPPAASHVGGPQTVRAVLLDVLGTLLALEPPAPLLVRELRRTHGIDLAPDRAESAFAAEIAYYREHQHTATDAASLLALRRRCAEVLRVGLGDGPAARLSAEDLRAAMLRSLRFAPYPDAPVTLAALAGAGTTLVAVSNWDIALEDVLRETGLRRLLRGVVSSAMVGAPKPSPAVFRAALDVAGVAAPEALHVGDSLEHDVRGALAAGVRAVLLRRGPRARRAGAGVENDDYGQLASVPTIATLAELPSLLSRAGGSAGAMGGTPPTPRIR